VNSIRVKSQYFYLNCGLSETHGEQPPRLFLAGEGAYPTIYRLFKRSFGLMWDFRRGLKLPSLEVILRSYWRDMQIVDLAKPGVKKSPLTPL
jgi:hypothetical protein